MADSGSPHSGLGLPSRYWLGAALALTLSPTRFVHPSHLDQARFGTLIRRLNAVPRCRADLDDYLLDGLALRDGGCTDFAAPITRLLLLDNEALARLCLYLGLVVQGDALRRELDGQRLRQIRALIGDNAYEFAYKRAPLLGRPPTIEPLTEDAAADLGLMRSGTRCLAAWLGAGVTADLAAARSRRLLLKLPVELSDALTEPLAASAPLDRLPPLLAKLLNEALPEWLPLFD